MIEAPDDGGAARRDRRSLAMLAAGVALFFLAFSNWSVHGMGYTDEDLDAVRDILRRIAAGFSGGAPIRHWPRHGVASVLSHVPFVLLARLFFGGDPAAEDRFVSFEPILASALIVVLVFAWVRRTSGSPPRACAVALLTAATTFVWPYAYISLETTQSAAVMLAGYLALGTPRRSAARSVLFAGALAMAVSAKATGVFLLPAAVYLLFAFFRRGPESAGGRRIFPAGAAAILVAAFFALNAWTRTFWWAQLGGTRHVIDKWLVRDPFVFLAHFVSLFGSANKGLFFYAPILIAAVLAGGAAWRRDRPVVVFALLTTVGLAAGFSAIRNWWADETWGPRYLHSAVGPIAILLGAAWARGSMPRTWRRAAVALGVLGLVVSFLGVFFYYGALQGACTAAGQSTLETLQGDPIWNHVVFDGRLFRAWARGAGEPGARPAMWVPAHYWWYETPKDFRGWKGVDLGPLAVPRPLIFRRAASLAAVERRFRWASVGALALGLALLAVALARVRQEERGAPPPDGPA